MKLRSRTKKSSVEDPVQSQASPAEILADPPLPPVSKAQARKINKSQNQCNRLKRLKASPVKYQVFRMMESARLYKHRKNRTVEQKARDRDTARIRMQRMRQQRKDEGLAQGVPKKKTRSEVTEQREKWRVHQKKYRASFSIQKQRRVNEKRRQGYAAKHEARSPSSPTTSDEPTPPKTDAAKRKALSRSWRVAPKCPETFAEVVTGMIRKSTPRKQAALQQKGIFTPPGNRQIKFLKATSVKTVLEDIRQSRKERDVQLRRLLYRSTCIKHMIRKSVAKKELGLSWTFLSNQVHDDNYRKKRSDAISQDTVTKVLRFFDRTSREMPNPRLVSKSKPTQVMECTMKAAFAEFKVEYPDIPLSFSKFTSLRPRHVKTVNNTKLMQCLCEYCINIDFKIRSLHKACLQVDQRDASLLHKYQASSATLCPTEGPFPKKECIDRECDDCGVEKLQLHLQPLVDECGETDAKWKRWQSEAYTKTTRSGAQTEAKHFVLREKVGPVSDLVEELLVELEPFSKHLTNAKWQGKQFEYLKNHIPKDWILTCMDFGQNYNCHFQDEAQSTHWSYQQATIHPIVVYYRCPECLEPMHESCVFINNDQKHDYHAVQHFVTATNEHLVSQGLTIKQQVQFSDGSPTQYKSKIPFSDASHGLQDFGWPVQKHFFGSRHGKGPCDGEIGVVKKCALTAVRSRRVVISNAFDLFQFCKESLSEPKLEEHVHMRRTFFFVAEGEICRDRKVRTDGIKPAPNTRARHSFIGVEPFIVTTKERSCFCDTCRGDTNQPCPNLDFTGRASLVSLKAGIQASTSHQNEDAVSAATTAHLVRAVPLAQVLPAQMEDVLSASVQAPSDEEIQPASTEGVLPTPVLPAEGEPVESLPAQVPSSQVSATRVPPAQFENVLYATSAQDMSEDIPQASAAQVLPAPVLSAEGGPVQSPPNQVSPFQGLQTLMSPAPLLEVTSASSTQDLSDENIQQGSPVQVLPAPVLPAWDETVQGLPTQVPPVEGPSTRVPPAQSDVPSPSLVQELPPGQVLPTLVTSQSEIEVPSTSSVQGLLGEPSYGDLRVGDFVAVKLQVASAASRKCNSLFVYMAEVVDITPSQVTVKYMKKQGNSLYAWPPVDDYSTQPFTDVVCVVKAPKLMNAREQFQFSNEEIQNIEMALQNQKVYFK